jgi:hypothetical protein
MRRRSRHILEAAAQAQPQDPNDFARALVGSS